MAGELGFDTGPFVNVATFCENVLIEKDGVLSAIRILDTLTVTAEGPEAPEALPPVTIQTKFLLIMKAGEARGSQAVRIDIERPDGSRNEGPEFAVNFSGGAGGGANLIMPMNIVVESPGLFWGDVHVNKRLMARVPLQINYGYTRGPALRPS